MKILFLSHYFPPEGNAPATRVHEMCKRWVKSGHRVTVVTCAPNVPTGKVYEGYRNRWRQRETIDGIEVVRVWTFIAANKGTFLRVLNYLSYMISATLAGLSAERPDVCIATSPQFFCGWAGALVSRLRRLPFVLEVRDIWPDSIVAVGAMNSRPPIRFLEWLEKKLYAAADRIVTVGDGYRRQLLEKGCTPERVTVVTNGIGKDTLVKAAPDEHLRKKMGLTDCFVCSYIGTIGMASGLDVVLRAARLMKEQQRHDVRFLLIGDGAVREELQRKATAEELGNVQFAGLQPKGSIPQWLALTDACLIHLKKQDLFRSVLPSKLLDACAAAKPVILGVEGFAAELLQKMDCGICIEPENEAELAGAVMKLQDHPALGRRMGESGRTYVVQHFDLDALAQRYLDTLQEIQRT